MAKGALELLKTACILTYILFLHVPCHMIHLGTGLLLYARIIITVKSGDHNPANLWDTR